MNAILHERARVLQEALLKTKQNISSLQEQLDSSKVYFHMLEGHNNEISFLIAEENKNLQKEVAEEKSEAEDIKASDKKGRK
jgi:hypothetical protein